MMRIPPLRNRKEDIPLLANHFIDYFNEKMNREIKDIDRAVKFFFDDYSWPGNVRELRNTIESAFNMAEGSVIKKADLPEYLSYYNCDRSLKTKNFVGDGLAQVVGEFEKDIIEEVLKDSESLSEASATLKITRQALKYKIEKYGIDYKYFLRM